jgi:hypothetical protein
LADPFDAIAPLYASIISEAKGRLRIIEQALSAPSDEFLEYVAISDLCALQFRKTFEAIALGCLAVHGDLPGTNRLRNDQYRADKLLQSLERLHRNFYPTPCRVTNNGPIKKVDKFEGEWLRKESLRRLYFEFDHEMHVGTLTRRSNVAKAIDKDSYRQILRGTQNLITTHWIKLLDGRRVLCETGLDKSPINISILEPH